LGLKLCPAETGPQLRLKYQDVFKNEQPMDEYLRIAMKQITASRGNPNVFSVDRDADGLGLNNRWAKPTYKWSLGIQFVFCLHKSFESW